MEQRTFNNQLEKLISDITKKYYYDHSALLNNAYDEVYNQLDYNFQEFDHAEFKYRELGNISLKVDVNLFNEENKLIQTIGFII